ncbi:hypothetical protein IW152_002407 [Coemansia sp. BCRC 34962]|nr:hypothetical protein IW152_002407 [Coemansia sp. BCRC 34962]
MDDASTSLESPGLGELLASLGSTLKTQIVNDMTAWEDRRRSEALAAVPGRGRKSGHNKRSRHHTHSDTHSLDTLPDPPETVLLGLRQIRSKLFESSEAVGAVSTWAIGILTLSVSLADMKEEFRLSDLLELPATKEVFGVLETAAESEFVHGGGEASETALIDRVLAATNDSRAVGWILGQYGAAHSDTFPRCLQIYAVAKMAQSSGLEATGLAQAVADFNSAHPRLAAKALDGILGLYYDAVSEMGDSADGVAAGNWRRFILFYVLQASRNSRGLRVLAESTVGGTGWLAGAVRFEMRTGFSLFHVCSEESKRVLRPLATAIEVLFVDSMAGRPKKPSDQSLDVERVISAFSLISAIVWNDDSAGTGDIAMADDTELVSFVGACHACLLRLIGREQELIVLNQMPRTVKNMLQPIPNGLHEAMLKGARVYNNGPNSMPTIGEGEFREVIKKLFGMLAEIVSKIRGKATAAASELYEMACDTVPMLVEILVARMVDAPDLVKRLIRHLVEDWPLRNGAGVVEMGSVRALYRALLAVSEANRGLLLSQLRGVFESALVRRRSPLLIARLEQIVDLLGAAVGHQLMLAKSPALVGCLLGLREVIGDLCGVLVVSWPRLWACCFGPQGAGDVSRLCVSLVRTMVNCLALPGTVPMRTIDCLNLAEHAVKELVRTQNSITDLEHSDGCLLELASALLALICALTKQPGVSHMAMERLLRVILLPSASTQGQSKSEVVAQLDAVFEISDGECSDNSSCVTAKRRLWSSGDSAVGLEQLLEGSVMPPYGDRKGMVDGHEMLAKAEHFLWQNSVRPMPKYPRSGMHRHDRTQDAWALVRSSTKAMADRGRPLLVFGLLSLAHSAPSGVAALCALLEEYYIDCLPSMPPHLLDERLAGGVRLQLRAVEMELVQDIRENPDLELVLLEVLRSGSPEAAKRLVSALVVALVVLWNGALGEPTTRRGRDLAFTTRLVAHVIEAYGERTSPKLCDLFSVVGGADLARLLHQYVWRWVIHRMPSAEDESQLLLRHILRRYVVKAAPLFKHLVTSN